jgi:hypothetical protein
MSPESPKPQSTQSEPHMSDDTLANLLRMAREAEDLERQIAGDIAPADRAHPGVDRSAIRPRAHRRLVGAGVVACLLGLGVLVTIVGSNFSGHAVLGRKSTSPTKSIPSTNAEATPTQVATHTPIASPPASTMFIALYRADTSPGEEPDLESCPKCWCLARWTSDQGPRLASLTDDELISSSISRACVPSPSQMVVIGLTGPAESMPTSDDQAFEVAMCLLDGDRPSESPSCLASSVDVRLETWNR